ncbi:MAG: DUF1587 domain-containing protein, partial [Acidobacteriota bacterium]|nr:DUF1587 domain-containing protein [Acidobacteriota bacterium]
MKRALVLALVLLACPSLAPAQTGSDPTAFETLRGEFDQKVLPLLERHCLDCHDTATTEGELDLERFANLAAVRRDPKTWQHVVEQLENGEMPPKKKDRQQPSSEERTTLIAWAKRYLDAEARAQAGDPGPVVLRRLSNSEFTYTVRDLTGIDSLDPLREFPVDSAAGEGFTNAGGALVMSPALFEKYLDAGKEIAQHAVLLPDGFRFSPDTSRADHSNEILKDIRALYLRTTGGRGINFAYTSQVRAAGPEGEGEGRLVLTPYFSALLAHRGRLLADPGAARAVAKETGLNAMYLGALTKALVSGQPANSFLLDHFRQRLRTAKADEAAALAAEVRSWRDQLWKFNKVGHLGLIRPWQEPITPLVTARDYRVKIEPTTKSMHLSAVSFGEGAATVQWQKPRIERPGRPPILLRDLQRGLKALEETRSAALNSTTTYLAA